MSARAVRRAALDAEFAEGMAQRPNEPTLAPVAPVPHTTDAEHECILCHVVKPGRFIRAIRNGWSRHMTVPVWECFDCRPNCIRCNQQPALGSSDYCSAACRIAAEENR